MNLTHAEQLTIRHAVFVALRANPDAFTEDELAILESVINGIES